MLDQDQILKLAYMVLPRARQFGVELDVEDMVQEARIIEMRCQKNHKADGGASFQTYATTSILRYFNTFVDVEIQKAKFEQMSVDESSFIKELGCNQSEKEIERDCHRSALIERLTPLQKRIVKALLEPGRRSVSTIRGIKKQLVDDGYQPSEIREVFESLEGVSI